MPYTEFRGSPGLSEDQKRRQLQERIDINNPIHPNSELAEYSDLNSQSRLNKVPFPASRPDTMHVAALSCPSNRSLQGEFIHPANISLSKEDLRAHYDDLRGRMDALTHENDLLRSGRSSEVYAFSLKLSEMEKSNQGLTSQIQKLNFEVENLQNEANLLKDEITSLKLQNAKSGSIIKELEGKCAGLEERNKALEQSVAEKDIEINSLNEEKVCKTKALAQFKY